MIVAIVAIVVALIVIGVVSFGFTVRDNEKWLSRKLTGHAPAKLDEDELEQLEHDRAGDT